MTNKTLTCALALLCCFSVVQSGKTQNVRKEKVALSSPSGNFLQCTCSDGGDGTTHANNRKVNKEETWWLWTVGDSNSHQVALQNFRNGYFLWRHPGGSNNHRARVTHDIGGDSTWTMVSGSQYGLPADYVAFRAYDGAYLKAWNGGGHANAPGENGEVYVDNGPPNGDIHWVGWWHMGEIAFDPVSGNDVWTSIGDGMTAFIHWVGNAINFAFVNGPTPAQSTVVTPPPISCSALPPPVNTETTRYVHAFCEGVTPSDYSGPFYSENDPNSSRRVDCDIEAHHQTKPTHAMIHQACDSGMTPTVGCEAVPKTPR